MPKVFGFTQYGGPDTQDFWDAPKPAPGAGELLIAVKAAGVNPVDSTIRNGHMQQVMPLDLPAGMGREASGVVEEVGQDVEGFAVGDEVFGNTAPGSGGFAEFTLLTAAMTAKKPVHVSFTDAASLAVAAATAFDGVQQIGLAAGQTLLIVGIGGGVGVAAAQIARDGGLNVIGTGSGAKRALVESLDATLIDYSGDVTGQVRAILPDGVDGVFDLVGGPALEGVAGLAADSSKIVSACDPATAAKVGGSFIERKRSSSTLDAIAALVADGKLNPHAVDVVPLDKAADAVASVESGHSQGKVVIEIQ